MSDYTISREYWLRMHGIESPKIVQWVDDDDMVFEDIPEETPQLSILTPSTSNTCHYFQKIYGLLTYVYTLKNYVLQSRIIWDG